MNRLQHYTLNCYPTALAANVNESDTGMWVRSDEAEAEISRLRKALESYADKRNWHRNQNGLLNIFHKDSNGPYIAFEALREIQK